MSQAQLAPVPEPSFRELEEADLPRAHELAAAFFEESEMGDFATYNPEGMERLFRMTLEQPMFDCLVFVDNGVIQGFVTYYMEISYTKEPVALGHLFYVTPEYRRSPVGRIMLDLAEKCALDNGCVAFYQGVMAGINSVGKTMPNMLIKAGYEPLFWGRKILKEEP